MAFLFGRNKQKGNMDLCRSTKELLQKLEVSTDPKMLPRVEEELARNLSQMKSTLQGTTEVDTSPEQVSQLVGLLMSEEVFLPIARNIHRLPFESRKDAQVIFSNVLRYRSPAPRTGTDEHPVLQYIVNQRPDVIITLCKGYEHRESAMPCGGVLREALKHDSIAALILYDEPDANGKSRGLAGVDPNVPASGNGVFWRFFEWIDKGAFEVSADAFSTFREVLTKHKKLVAHFLVTNMNTFVPLYNRTLVQSSSYVTKRQSINLLSTLLLERSNYTLMTRYVESAENLKLCMNLLKDDRRMVNYEAFHVFKIFIANPNKSVPVQRILINNRERLLKFLPGFLDDRTDDVQFTDEKAYLIRQIEQLPPQPVPPQGSGSDVQQQQQHTSGQGVVGGGRGAVIA